MYDVDSRSPRLEDHDFIGSASCTLAQIVTSGPGRGLALNLVNAEDGRNRGNGTLYVACEEMSTCKDDLQLQFMGKKLDKKDFFGSSDPFLVFYR